MNSEEIKGDTKLEGAYRDKHTASEYFQAGINHSARKVVYVVYVGLDYRILLF